jgi:hypothetical protein
MANNRNNCGCGINITYFKECGINNDCKTIEVEPCNKATRLNDDDLIRTDNTPTTLGPRNKLTVIPCKNTRVFKHEVEGKCGYHYYNLDKSGKNSNNSGRETHF